MEMQTQPRDQPRHLQTVQRPARAKLQPLQLKSENQASVSLQLQSEPQASTLRVNFDNCSDVHIGDTTIDGDYLPGYLDDLMNFDIV